MLPLQQAYEVKYSIIEYLKATFGFKEKAVQKSFNDFIEREVFKCSLSKNCKIEW